MRPKPPIDTDPERHAERRRRLRALSDVAFELAHGAGVRASQELAAPPEPAPKGPAWPAVALFERACRVVRQVVALEDRYVTTRPAPPGSFAPGSQDPRWQPIREHFHRLTAHHPERTEIRRALDAAIGEALGGDPAHERVAAEFMALIAAEFGLPFDFADVPDSLLFLPGQIPRSPYEHERTGAPPRPAASPPRTPPGQ